MPLFSQTITEFWKSSFGKGDVVHSDAVFTLVVNPDLGDDKRIMILKRIDGQVSAVLTPTMAERAGVYRQENMSEQVFRRKLQETGATLHGADCLFYFSRSEREGLLHEPLEGSVRQLRADDKFLFSGFEAAALDQDLEDAYVELDHWAVFGAFEEARLIAAASMYLWENEPIADLGVLTLVPFRGKGHARRIVRSISKFACDQGCEPQYRCQLDNLASRALAKAAGLTLFGTWEVISPVSVA